MGAKVKTKKISGRTYSVTQMPASEAVEYEMRYGLLLASSLESFLSARGQDSAGQLKALTDAVTRFRSEIDPKELAGLIRTFCEMAACDGARIQFDEHFTGSEGIALRYQVFAFVVEANYGDFFGALGLGGVFSQSKPEGGSATPTQ